MVTKKNITDAAAIINDPRWLLVCHRDASADGLFYYAVKTTGIYCRPSCGSKTAKPENIWFYLTAKEAENAGFRPCQRCKPDQLSPLKQQTQLIADLCRFIENSETPPTLNQLAERAQLSAYHLHRLFKTVTGVTPKAYAMAQRHKKIRHKLEQSQSVTEAIYDAGYNTSSRFYDQSHHLIGMSAKNYRAGGKNTVIHFAIGQCFLGAILVAISEIGICAINLDNDPEVLIQDLQNSFPNAELIGGHQQFEQLAAKVIAFVEAPKNDLDLPLDIRGTAFQQRVWQALQKIPVGQTASYSNIAEQIGSPKAVRAVAQACAANNLAVAIPCHRVIRQNGDLSGYRWGIERKHALLKRETKT